MLANLLLAALLSTPLPDSVYVTPMGQKFHAQCHRDNCMIVSRLDAESAGYEPAKCCFSQKPRKARPWDLLPRGAK